MGTAFALAALAGCVLLLLPIPVVLAVRWDDSREVRWSLSLRIGGFPLVRLPQARRPERTPSEGDERGKLPPWLGTLLDWTLARWRALRSGKKRKSGRSGRDPIELLKHLAGAALVRPTRGLRLELGGFDPALLAAVHGLFLSIRPLLPGGGDVVRVAPDWTAFRPRVRLVWSWRSSMAGFVGGLVGAFLASGRRPPKSVVEEAAPAAG